MKNNIQKPLEHLAASLGLELDLSIARKLGVTPEQLIELHLWREQCAQANSAVCNIMELLLPRFITKGSLHSEQLEIVGRVKNINSILKKFLTQKRKSLWPTFSKIEDIAGVRVVCLTFSEVKALESLFLSEDARTLGITLSAATEFPHRDFHVKDEKSDYKAIHIVVDVKTYDINKDLVVVPCEIQLRTVFHDLWSQVSRKKIYKGSKKNRRLLRGEVNKLAILVSECQTLVDKIIDS